MGTEMRVWLLAAVCAAVLLMGALRRRAEWLLNLLMRAVTGCVAIYFINLGTAALGIPTLVGINPATALTCGFLGFPGLAALYGLGFYQFM